MSNYPMVNQINRLVSNLLAGGGEVFLPGVGSLYTEHRGARRISRRSVLPPSRTVSFTSQERGVSLVTEIAGAVQCDAAEAQDIYDRWLARTLENEVLTIEGVGVLRFKNFTPDAAFDKQLNPQGHEPVRLRPARKFDWALWIGIAAILLAIGFGGYEFLKLYAGDEQEDAVAAHTSLSAAGETAVTTDSLGMTENPVNAANSNTPAESATAVSGMDAGTTAGAAASASGARGETAAKPAASAAAGTTSSGTATSASEPAGTATTSAGTIASPSAPAGNSDAAADRRTSASATGANAGTPAGPKSGKPGAAPAARQDNVSAREPETRPLGTADAPASLVSGRRYVVLGVFSTPENAARAAADAAKKDASVRCGIYRFGAKFMVSPFESADAEACTLFIRNYNDRFPGLWTYTAR